MSGTLWVRDLAAVCFQMAVLVIAGTILPFLAGLRMPKVKLIYWQALLGACLLLPLIQPWRAGVAGPALVSISSAVEIPATAATATSSMPSIPWPDVVLFVLLAGIAIRLAWLCLGLRRLGVLRRDSSQAEEALPAVLEAQRLVPVKARVRIAHNLSSPAAFGLRSPVILLPHRFLVMPLAQQKAVACHEFLHIRRRDWAWNLAEEIVLAALWFHPAVWWLIRNIRLSREQTVDAEVVRLTASPGDYLGGLLAIARMASNSSVGPAPSFLAESQLAARVSLLLKEVHMSRRKQAAICIVSAVVLLAAGRAAVWAFPLDSLAAAQQGEVAAASRERGKLVPRVTEQSGASDEGVRRIYGAGPEYPAAAAREGIQGTVAAVISVGRQGTVTSVTAIGGSAILKEAVVNALKQWRYEPNSLLPGRETMRFDFRMVPRRRGTFAVRSPGVNAQFSRASGLKLIHPAFIVYPPLARIARIQGNVLMTITVNKDGTVSDTHVLSGHPLLAKAVLEAVHEWKFQPPASAPVITEVGVAFRLPPPAHLPSTIPGPATITYQGRTISKIYTAGVGGVQEPIAKHSHTPSPPYPSAAKRAKVSGSVVFSVVVAPDGTVAWLKEISKPLGMGIDESAEKALRTWKFYPGMLNGKPVAVKMRVVIAFHLVGVSTP